MKQRRIAALGVVIVAGATLIGAAMNAAARPVTPRVDPSAFTNPKPNPYYPLVPGTVSVYHGIKDGQTLVTRVTVTHDRKVIEGVTTTVVRDVARHAGSLVEKTFDWYATDNGGNVWYFGENTAEYDASGHVISTEGSWEAGVDGAQPGYIMVANPMPPASYRQEYYAGHAEDQAWIVNAGAKVTVPYGHLKDVVQSLEWTRLDPTVVDQKDYAPGLGIVLEQDLTGSGEISKLVSVIKHH